MQKHSRITEHGRAFWFTERRWQKTAGLAVNEAAISSIPEFDMNCRFRKPPTCRDVAKHARQSMDADLSFPIILSSDGRLMDGGHRSGRAWLEGRNFVLAQRFERDPEHDYIEPWPQAATP